MTLLGGQPPSPAFSFALLGLSCRWVVLIWSNLPAAAPPQAVVVEELVIGGNYCPWPARETLDNISLASYRASAHARAERRSGATWAGPGASQSVSHLGLSILRAKPCPRLTASGQPASGSAPRAARNIRVLSRLWSFHASKNEVRCEYCDTMSEWLPCSSLRARFVAFFTVDAS